MKFAIELETYTKLSPACIMVIKPFCDLYKDVTVPLRLLEGLVALREEANVVDRVPSVANGTLALPTSKLLRDQDNASAQEQRYGRRCWRHIGMKEA